MTQFEKIFRELNKAKIKYLVVGGVAVNLYGYAYEKDLVGIEVLKHLADV